MMDDVVEEVGEENIIQIVTDNATNYKTVGELLIQKKKKLYWTLCVAHYIDLMLEDFDKKISLHRETITNGKKIKPTSIQELVLSPCCANILKG